MSKSRKYKYQMLADFALRGKLGDFALALNTPEKVDAARCLLSPDEDVRNRFCAKTNGELIVTGLFADLVNVIRDKAEDVTRRRLEISEDVRAALEGFAALLGDRESALIAHQYAWDCGECYPVEVRLSVYDLLKVNLAKALHGLERGIEKMIRAELERRNG